jgi:hypothetical protein
LQISAFRAQSVREGLALPPAGTLLWRLCGGPLKPASFLSSTLSLAAKRADLGRFMIEPTAEITHILSQQQNALPAEEDPPEKEHHHASQPQDEYRLREGAQPAREQKRHPNPHEGARLLAPDMDARLVVVRVDGPQRGPLIADLLCLQACDLCLPSRLCCSISTVQVNFCLTKLAL